MYIKNNRRPFTGMTVIGGMNPLFLLLALIHLLPAGWLFSYKLKQSALTQKTKQKQESIKSQETQRRLLFVIITKKAALFARSSFHGSFIKQYLGGQNLK
jgi:hypothetical protein